eukprot:TRINITY_DN6856_c0_g1_i4.p1 TRINITY_DN6856_c0_g1~~TRINITY_DN6856_c0_g1_i4.p1  ORF type:complete len:637 (-),score=212.30 TRINITY_DN6856_c0_g1_i4:93-2003(-)
MKAERDGAYAKTTDTKAIHESATSKLRVHSIEMRQAELEREFQLKDYEIRNSADELNKATAELQEIKARIIQLQGKISEESYYATIVRDLEKELQERTAERNQLQARIAELAKSPFSKDAEDLDDIYKKLTTVERRIETLKSEDFALKERKRKAIYENERLKTQLNELRLELQSVRMEIDSYSAGVSNDYLAQILAAHDPSTFRELMRKLGFEGGIPPWALTSAMLPKESVGGRSVQALLSEIERLNVEKAELASELEKMEAYLKETGRIEETKYKLEARLEDVERKIVQSPFKDRDFLRKELAETKKSFKAPEMAGEADSASEFSVESHVSELPPNNNVLELLIIEGVFDEGKHLTSLPTLTSRLEVMFYNHNSTYSTEKEGARARYGLQIGFQVEVDDELLSYLYKNAIEIYCYAREETGLRQIGKASIKLRKFFDFMLSKNAGGTFSERVQILSVLEENKGDIRIGYLRYKLKMRSSIEPELVQYRAKMESQYITTGEEGTKTYRIKILYCKGLLSTTHRELEPFVYFEFFKESCRTKTASGNDPVFDEERLFNINMNADFKEYLSNKEMKLTVMDSHPGAEEKGTSSEYIIGEAAVKLSPLLAGNRIEDRFPLYAEKGSAYAGQISLVIEPV